MPKKREAKTTNPIISAIIYGAVVIAIGASLALTLYRLQLPLNAHLETRDFFLLIGLAMAVAAPVAIYIGRIGVIHMVEAKRIRQDAKLETNARRQIDTEHRAQQQTLAGLGILAVAIILGYGLAGGVIALNAFAGAEGETLTAKVESAREVRSGSGSERQDYCRLKLAVSNGTALTLDRRRAECRLYRRGMEIEIAYAPGLFTLPVYSLVPPNLIPPNTAQPDAAQ